MSEQVPLYYDLVDILSLICLLSSCFYFNKILFLIKGKNLYHLEEIDKEKVLLCELETLSCISIYNFGRPGA